MSLRIDPEKYEIKTFEFAGIKVTARAFEGLDYCENPKHPVQKINIYVPEGYYHGETINGYDAKTAPVFMPNMVGGYMEGRAMVPGEKMFGPRGSGQPNTAILGLAHGYVLACPGIRGRNTGTQAAAFFEGGTGEKSVQDEDTKPCGKAPALLVDMKAAIRFVRHNRDLLPGDTEKIITNGTSAGGALSAMTGATGNSPDYEPYLKEIGAADERDDIFGASCYCPITNLDNADTAYEWLFNGENTYHKFQLIREGGEMRRVPVEGTMSDEKIRISGELKALFPAYLNSLNLKDEDGNLLTLGSDGEGSFKEYVKNFVIRSANRELETHKSETNNRDIMVPGSEIDGLDFLTKTDGKITDIDFRSYVAAITRMKQAPAFDSTELDSPENSEFGTETIENRHFTKYALENDPQKDTYTGDISQYMAEEEIIKLLNPMNYVGNADTAPNWRIRHGAYDRDTSIAVPVMLMTLLKNRGCNVDFALPWGIPHSGDYDIDEMFAWIDSL